MKLILWIRHHLPLFSLDLLLTRNHWSRRSPLSNLDWSEEETFPNRNTPRRSWNRTFYDGCHTFQAACSRYRPKRSISEIPMTSTFVQCDCPPCTCSVEEATAVTRGNKLFCSEACATEHINQVPCHGATHCGCNCSGWLTTARSTCECSDCHPHQNEVISGCHH